MAVNFLESTFDPDVFEETMEAVFGPHAVGYGYALNYDGEIAAAAGGGGEARTSADSSPPMGFDEMTEMELASVSKPITAVALIYLLQTQIKKAASSPPTIQSFRRCWTTTARQWPIRWAPP